MIRNEKNRTSEIFFTNKKQGKKLYTLKREITGYNGIGNRNASK